MFLASVDAVTRLGLLCARLELQTRRRKLRTSAGSRTRIPVVLLGIHLGTYIFIWLFGPVSWVEALDS